MRLFGACCPCIESESDQLFRLADLSLQLVPVLWFRKIKHHVKKPNDSGTSSYLCAARDYLYCGGCYDDIVDDDTKRNNTDNEDEEAQHMPQQVRYSPYVPLNATLSVIDTNWYGPALRVSSNHFVFADDDVIMSNQPSKASGVIGTISDKVTMTKTIPLSEIDSATAISKDECLKLGLDGAEDFVVVVKSKFNKAMLLVFHVIPPGHGVDMKKCKTRDQVVDHINMLLTWNSMQVDKTKKGSVANADIEVVNNAEVGANFVMMTDDNNKDQQNGESQQQQQHI